MPDTGRAKNILPFIPRFFLKNEVVRVAASTEPADVGYRKVRVAYLVVLGSSFACRCCY